MGLCLYILEVLAKSTEQPRFLPWEFDTPSLCDNNFKSSLDSNYKKKGTGQGFLRAIVIRVIPSLSPDDFTTCQQDSGDPNSGLVWILNGRKVVGLQMVLIFNGI